MNPLDLNPAPSVPVVAAPSVAVVAIASSRVGSRVVLDVAGEIDIATAPSLLEAVRAAASEHAVEIWVDLTRTEFVDSAGLNALLDARTELQAMRRRLAIICPGGPIRRTFEVAGLDCVLPLYRSRAGAHRHA